MTYICGLEKQYAEDSIKGHDTNAVIMPIITPGKTDCNILDTKIKGINGATNPITETITNDIDIIKDFVAILL